MLPKAITASVLLERINLYNLKILEVKIFYAQNCYAISDKNKMIGVYLKGHLHPNSSHKS